MAAKFVNLKSNVSVGHTFDRALTSDFLTNKFGSHCFNFSCEAVEAASGI